MYGFWFAKEHCYQLFFGSWCAGWLGVPRCARCFACVGVKNEPYLYMSHNSLLIILLSFLSITSELRRFISSWSGSSLSNAEPLDHNNLFYVYHISIDLDHNFNKYANLHCSVPVDWTDVKYWRTCSWLCLTIWPFCYSHHRFHYYLWGRLPFLTLGSIRRLGMKKYLQHT